MLALPIFPGSHPPSIVGADVLNFCVRDGNRWTHIAINTNYGDGFSPSIYVKARCALTAKRLYHQQETLSIGKLVTRTGFEPMLTA